ncbi:MAG: hypothetical protein ACJAZO_004539 [Myxococcota bacterium]
MSLLAALPKTAKFYFQAVALKEIVSERPLYYESAAKTQGWSAKDLGASPRIHSFEVHHEPNSVR